MSQFSLFEPRRDAFLFGWEILGEAFLIDSSGPTVVASGGGGFGAVMDASHAARYHHAYESGGYRPAYASRARSGAYRASYKPAYDALRTPRYRDELRRQK